ncbi:single-stranded DNA-binding protein [Lelliottia wanjuensis]|uniref:single-stranded DNA-binding protein n=1 Tax=Lelliottia wanjuensis TaxID=3050585 RepID=UPI00254B096F|nr:single-stranded DNA-binding protein [Lelliottia sp. V104_15]MDK9605516.1 single-stranded DNA-binding protein [Lelliottia sp. V104_15]
MTAQLAAYGRIAADVQTIPTSNGSIMAYSRMAVSLPCRDAEDGSGVMWLDITAFGKQAEALARQQKGDLLSVSGTLQLRQWAGQNGGTQSGYGLVVESLVSSQTVRPGNSVGKRTAGKKQTQSQPPAQPHQPPAGNDFADDDPPF